MNRRWWITCMHVSNSTACCICFRFPRCLPANAFDITRSFCKVVFAYESGKSWFILNGGFLWVTKAYIRHFSEVIIFFLAGKTCIIHRRIEKQLNTHQYFGAGSESIPGLVYWQSSKHFIKKSTFLSDEMYVTIIICMYDNNISERILI